RLPGRLDEARRAFDAFLVGAATSIDVSVDLALASAFQRTVLGVLRDRVGYGARASYGEVARWVGRPTAARAVGAALGANPLCLVVPCHRVVGASGDVTGYAGGLAAKRMLLQLESGRP
ncbi:MAG: methylated-DNA--[protein]-cysteine S-methyltransferase, partial [Candidatus Phosphoribacter sp.]